MKNTRKLTVYAILIALSVVGSYIVIPSVGGTISFDSFSGYLASCFFSPVAGGGIGALGHLITAFIKGFPLGLPAHLIVALTMFIAVTVFGFLYKKGARVLAVIIGTILNGPVSLLPFLFIVGKEFYLAMLLPLTLASLLNILIAVVLYERLKDKVRYE